MDSQATTVVPKAGRFWRSLLKYALAAAVIAPILLGAMAYLKIQQDQVVEPLAIEGNLDSGKKLRPLAEFVKIARELKLVTVSAQTTVTVRVSNESWRGDVSVLIEAPVTYLYGVDLAKLDDSAFSLDAATKTYRVEIPKPARLSTEVDGGSLIRDEVQVTGTRLRTRAGEYYRGQAQQQLYGEAQQQALAGDKLKEIEDRTLEQTYALLKKFNPDCHVEVVYKL